MNYYCFNINKKFCSLLIEWFNIKEMNESTFLIKESDTRMVDDLHVKVLGAFQYNEDEDFVYYCGEKDLQILKSWAHSYEKYASLSDEDKKAISYIDQIINKTNIIKKGKNSLKSSDYIECPKF